MAYISGTKHKFLFLFFNDIGKGCLVTLRVMLCSIYLSFMCFNGDENCPYFFKKISNILFYVIQKHSIKERKPLEIYFMAHIKINLMEIIQ